MEQETKKSSKLVAILFVFVVVCGSLFLLVRSFSLTVSQLDETEQKEIQETILLKNPLSSLEQTTTGYTNALLLGIGGVDHTSGELTDSIMLLSLSHTQQHPSFIFSIPRDFWVRGANNEFTKINELYKQGGGTQDPDHRKTSIIKETIETITGQPIHYTIVIDLVAIEKLANFFGGITIDGIHYSGETLTTYLRNRSLPGSDFTRMKNQQKALVALFAKIEQENLLDNLEQVNEAYKAIEGNISVNIDVTDYFGAFEISQNISSDNIQLHSITPENNLLSEVQRTLYGFEVYALVPEAGEEDYNDIALFIETILSNGKQPNPSDTEITAPAVDETTLL